MAKVGLQLYSIKEETAKDFLGTLDEVARMGYDGVEFAGFFDTDAAELKVFLNDHELLPAASHHGYDPIRTDLDTILEYLDVLGCDTVICPGFSQLDVEKGDTFAQVADFFNDVGAHCKNNGFRFMYHLHGYEFRDFGGKTGMDIFLEHADPSLVSLELDTYWVERGGANALAFLKEHAARIPYIHLKDFEDRDEWFDAEIGNGLLNTAEIIAEGLRNDVEWFIVEQEAYRIPMMESVAISEKNIRDMLAS